MIITENITIDGREFIKKDSDSGFYIERDGELYSDAIDPVETLREYVETDIPIESDEHEENDEPTREDLLSALNELGVDTNDN